MRVLIAVCLFTLLGGTVDAQEPAAVTTPLTAQDYVEIRRAALYYNLGWDSAASSDGGHIVRRTFTPDAIFRPGNAKPWRGGDEVGDAAAQRANQGINHWDTNLVIQPHGQGARVFRYTLVLNVEASGQGGRATGGGPLYELFVKTPEGWFIKERYHDQVRTGKAVEWPSFPARSIAQSAAPPSSSGQQRKLPPLSALDYVEIEMLYGWNNIAFDSGKDNGEMFASTFTADGTLEIGGRTVSGRKELAALAAKGPHGLRRWLSNLYVEPAADGAVGWAYQLDIDLGDKSSAGAPVAVREGGLYRDDLVKTPDGWRFKRRVFTAGNKMPASLPQPGPR